MSYKEIRNLISNHYATPEKIKSIQKTIKLISLATENLSGLYVPLTYPDEFDELEDLGLIEYQDLEVYRLYTLTKLGKKIASKNKI